MKRESRTRIVPRRSFCGGRLGLDATSGQDLFDIHIAAIEDGPHVGSFHVEPEGADVTILELVISPSDFILGQALHAT